MKMFSFGSLINAYTILLSAGLCSTVAVGVSTMLISQHLRNFTQPSIQAKIVAITYMIPIYSVDSFLGLLFPDISMYINLLRDCYEAYVLYLFLSLMLSYLGCDDDDSELALYLDSHMHDKESEALCCMPAVPHAGQLGVGRRFLRQSKFGVLQYCLVRPLSALLAILLDLLGVYGDGKLSLAYAYLYIAAALNMSVLLAFCALASFFHALHAPLSPYSPVPKLLCVKFVVFFAFWQSVLLTGLVQSGHLDSFGDYAPPHIDLALQDWLVCVEMAVAAFAFRYAFAVSPFLLPRNPESRPSSASSSGQRQGRGLAAFHKAQARSGARGKAGKYPRLSGAYQKLRSRGTEDGQGLEEGTDALTAYLLAPAEASEGLGEVEGAGIHMATLKEPRAPPGRSAHAGAVSAPLWIESSSGAALSLRDKAHMLERSLPPLPLLQRHFAAESAVRDFNEAMPVLSLPSRFQPARGRVVRSDPEERLRKAAEAQEGGGEGR